MILDNRLPCAAADGPKRLSVGIGLASDRYPEAYPVSGAIQMDVALRRAPRTLAWSRLLRGAHLPGEVKRMWWRQTRDNCVL